MTDVQVNQDETPDAPNLDAEAKTRRPKSSEYATDFTPVPLPKVVHQGAGGTGPRESQLDKLVGRVMDAFPDGTPGDNVVCIATYGNGGSGASATKATLQERYPKDEGWFFYSRTLVGDDGEARTDENGAKMRGLFVQYKPAGDGVDQGDDEDEVTEPELPPQDEVEADSPLS